MSDDGPLRGIKVLEVAEHSFVPSAVAVLADWGADVVKVERPAGDANRLNMKWGYTPDTGTIDTTFEQVNRGKRGIVLDLAVTEGRQAFDRLLAWADVFVTNQLPSVRTKLRLDPDDVFAVNPAIVYARGSGWGPKGPMAGEAGYDFVSFWARAGIGHTITPVGSPIVNPRGAFGDVTTGMYLAGGIAAALVGAQRTGKGTVVDASLLAGGIWSMGLDIAATSVLHHEPPRYDPEEVRFSPLVGFYETSEGRWIALNMLNEGRYWEGFCTALAPELLTDPRFVDEAARSTNRVALRDEIRVLVRRRDLAWLGARFAANDCLYAVLATVPEVLADEQVVANGYTPVHPDRADVRLAASPVQFDEEPMTIRRAAPDTGQHTDELLAEVGLSAAEIDALRATGALG